MRPLAVNREERKQPPPVRGGCFFQGERDSILLAAPIHVAGEELAPAGDVQLAEDAVDVGLYRADGDVELVADLLVALARQQQAQDLLLPRGELMALAEGDVYKRQA